MSDHGLADDLFGDSDNEAPPQPPSPVASNSKSPAPVTADASGAASPRETKPSPPTENGVAPDEDDLFGDDDEDQKRAASSPPTSDTPSKSPSPRSVSPNPLEYAEEEGQEEVELRTATLPLPQWPHMKATDGKVWHMKLPAYVNIDPRPYDAELYRETLDEDPIDGKTDPLAAKGRMIGVRNTMRWRWTTGTDGEPVSDNLPPSLFQTRQSNARMLRWSDGSVSLQLGSDLFDIAPSYGATLARPSDPQPNLPTASSASTSFLCVAARDQGVLVTESAIAGQLSIVPTSMSSKTHMELVKHVGQQHVKHSRMKILDDIQDPEQVKALLLKAAGPAARAAKRDSRRRNAKRAASEESFGSDEERRRDLDYDEDDGFVVADDDEEEEEEEDLDEDDDDAEYGAKSGKKAKRRKRGDDIDEAEARIEAKERARKRAKRGKPSKKSREYVDSEGEEEDMDMDDDDE